MASPFTRRPRLSLAYALTGVAILVFGTWRLLLKPAQAASPVAAAPAARNGNVSAAGRIEPAEPVTHVGAPYINGHAGMIAELKVAEGDYVSRGQLVAVLNGRQELEAAVRQAEARVMLDQVKLDQVKAGPRTADRDAQKAEVERCRAALANAQAEFQRYELLQKTHDVSTSEVDAKRAEMENARQLLQEAGARLAGLTEIRPADIRSAEAQLAASRAELDRARLQLGDTQVRSPAAGLVLHIRARPGEEVGPQGVLELAKTAEMCVIAEVYETDAARVRLGEDADIRSELLPGQVLHGRVAVIGREIGRTDLPPADPATFADSRVVLVKIHLEDSRQLAGMIHGKVMVLIHS